MQGAYQPETLQSAAATPTVASRSRQHRQDHSPHTPCGPALPRSHPLATRGRSSVAFRAGAALRTGPGWGEGSPTGDTFLVAVPSAHELTPARLAQCGRHHAIKRRHAEPIDFIRHAPSSPSTRTTTRTGLARSNHGLSGAPGPRYGPFERWVRAGLGPEAGKGADRLPERSQPQPRDHVQQEEEAEPADHSSSSGPYPMSSRIERTR